MRSAPCRRATATYNASRMMAVALIVIDVDTSDERDACEEIGHVLDRVDRHADPSDLAFREGVVRVVADLCRQVERHAQAAHALREQVPVPSVGLPGRPEPGVLTHRPEPSAIGCGMDAARVRKATGEPEIARRVPSGEIIRSDKMARHWPNCAMDPLTPVKAGRTMTVVPPTHSPTWSTLGGRSLLVHPQPAGLDRQAPRIPSAGGREEVPHG